MFPRFTDQDIGLVYLLLERAGDERLHIQASSLAGRLREYISLTRSIDASQMTVKFTPIPPESD